MGTILLSEVKSRIRKVMGEHSINGEVIVATDENRMDYDLRMNSVIDMHQRKIATTLKKISKCHRFTQYPPVNTIPNPSSQFDVVRFEGETLYFQGESNAKSYCVKVDGSCTITIEQSVDGITYTTLETQAITITTYGKFETYKSNISPTTDYYVRMKIEGTYNFNVRSIALYDTSFPTDNDIPVYEDYRAYTMPSDLYAINYIMLNGQMADSKQYQKTSDFRLEGSIYIYIPWAEKGEYRIYYWAYPTKIDDTTADTIALDIDDEAIDVVVYGCACDLLDDEKTEAYKRLKNKYNTFLATLDSFKPTGGATIANRLFAGNNNNKLF